MAGQALFCLFDRDRYDWSHQPMLDEEHVVLQEELFLICAEHGAG